MAGSTMRSLRDRLRYFLPLAFGSAAISSCSLVFCQLESGLYSFMALALTVFMALKEARCPVQRRHFGNGVTRHAPNTIIALRS
jgi:hypothetical protein